MSTAHTPPHESAGRVLASLARTRAAVRRVLVAERSGQAIAFGVAAIVVAVLLDRVLRLPAPVRVIELAALVLGAVAWFWRRVLPALRFNPPLVEVALRLEHGQAEARGTLAAGADFAQAARRDASGTGGASAAAAANGATGAIGAASASGASGASGATPAHAATGANRPTETTHLTSEVVLRAAEVAPRAALGRVDSRPARKALLAAAASLALFAAIAIFSPETARIALARLLTPFADVQWPARTMVEPAMALRVHPRGAALALRAKPVRGEPADMRVEAQYRLLRDGTGEWRNALLSLQPDGAFERLVETDGDAIEVIFRTEDMETAAVRIALVAPPAVERARVSITPPAYAAGSVDARQADLGTGTDRRATLSPPVLAGSAIALDLQMRGTMPPPVSPDAAVRSAWIARTIKIAGAEGTLVEPSFEIDPADAGHWTVRWNAAGRGVVELSPEGAEGIGPAQRIAFEIPSIDDAAPTIAITEPAADEAVTPEATPLVVAEGRDDLLISKAWLVVAGAKELARFEGVPGPAARVEATLSLKEYGVQAGDRIMATAFAVDAFESNGTPRAPVASTPRIFRIISASELSEQVRSRLGQLREAAGRLRQEQGNIAEATRRAAERTESDGAEATDAERTQLAGTQGRMSDRIAAFERALAELGGRLERNHTDGEGLSQSIEEAQRTARTAAQRAQEAAAALPQAQQAKEATERAEESERALADLETALERDRETAELARRIDRLSEQIAAARRDTKAAEARSVGRERAQLDEATRAQLDRAAQAQREAAKEARALTEALGERAQEAERREQPDPGAAQSMREAAKEAEERGLARQLEQAAQQTEQNQLQGAQQSQQQASQAVEAMQRAMRNQQKARTDELQRRITSIVESLRSLLGGIEQASLPLQKLVDGDAPGAASSSGAVLALARNAAGIALEAAASGPQTRRVASLVDRAAELLDGSATALRATPADLAAARDQLERARQSVQEALATAQKADRDAQRDAENRRRAELRELYAQVLDRQRATRAGTEAVLPPIGKQLDRRAFIECRRLAGEQGGVTALLTNLGARPDVQGSALFSASQAEMTSASKLAALDLGASALTRRTVLVQKEVEASLAALIQALEDPPEPDDPFAQQPADAGKKPGGGGGGGAGDETERLPPIAELRLLRTMAQQVLDDTRSASELPLPERQGYLARITARQQKIVELGERWMRAMEERARMNAPAGAPVEDAPGGADGAGGEGGKIGGGANAPEGTP